MRPNYTVNDNLMEIWPADPWSRKKIAIILEELSLEYVEIPTTMDTYAYRFSKNDYFLLKDRLQKM